MKKIKSPHIILISAWLVFTVSLAAWWLVFGLMQIHRVEKLAGADPVLADEILRGQRMLHWEGGTLILLLILGGVALLYFSIREQKRGQQVREFFASMTHELKTPLASLRIQIESLQEDLAGTTHVRLVERLLSDSVRLELQLENALFLASMRDASQLHIENIGLMEILNSLKEHWPEIKIESKDLGTIKADSRALEGILKNLIQNSRVHGRATQITISSQNEGQDHLRLTIEDNGQGFKGDRSRLGELFARHTSVSGSGVGLYLSKQLASQLGGRLEFDADRVQGFKVDVVLRRGAV